MLANQDHDLLHGIWSQRLAPNEHNVAGGHDSLNMTPINVKMISWEINRNAK